MQKFSQRLLLVTGLVITIVATIVLSTNPMQANLSGQQALAFIQGKLSIPDTAQNRAQDAAIYNGTVYSPFPPLPAILMIPFVVFLGANAPMSILLIPIFIGIAYIFWKIQNSVPDITFSRNWLLWGFLFSTPIWPTLMYGYGVWYSAQLIGLFFVLLALWLSLMKNQPNGIYVGAALALAFLCRQLTIFLTPIFLVLLFERISQHEVKKWHYYLKDVAGFSFCLVVGISFYLLFNYLRFGNPLDTGYSYIVPDGFTAERLANYGLYNSHYALFNLTYYFFQGFHIQFGGNAMLQIQGVDLFGSALLVSSPFLIAAFYAQPSKPLRFTAWIVITAMVLSQIFYHNNGYVQLSGHRFSLDYLPILMLLTILGAKHFPSSFIKATIVWGFALNFYALLVMFLTYGLPR